MSDSENSGCFLRQTLLGCLFIGIAVVVCSIGSVVGIDVICHNDIEQTMLLYPGAELVSEQGGFFRVRGMGKSEIVFTTPDPVADVRKWYRDQKLERERALYDEATGRSNSPRHTATVDFVLTEDAKTQRTLITFHSECGYN